MQTLFLLLILIAGSGLAFQAPINARLREYTGNPVLGALISFCVGTILLLAIAIGSNAFASATRLRAGPWWVFIGGSFGVLYVVSAMVAVPRIGASMLLAATVAGQMLAALLIDHYGWFGLDVSTLTPKRFAGAILLTASLWCLRK